MRRSLVENLLVWGYVTCLLLIVAFGLGWTIGATHNYYCVEYDATTGECIAEYTGPELVELVRVKE